MLGFAETVDLLNGQKYLPF